MTCPIRNRSRLLVGCGSSALALALALGLPQRAEAQGINASGEVLVPGSAAIDDMVPGQTTVDVTAPTAVIDWTPFVDNNGDALDFLPTGNTVTFRSGQLPDFAVLNRILPTANGNVVVIDGTVLSRVFDPAGNTVPGGFVAFYSPTGILIGGNAVFDVGSLLLTTLEPDVASFQNFAENDGTLSLLGASGSTARIQIDAGAQITASPENAFFAVVAADVQMSGTALVNGSHAYVAGEVVNLRLSNGLFDIEIPVGTAAGGTVMNINGTVGGPSSTGAADAHMIYGVAAAQNDPISMLFSGNLGFEPAQQAGILNGEIILSANYDVFGRTVDNSLIADGIDATFNGNSQTSAIRADILIEDLTATSSLLAIGTHLTRMSATAGASNVQGNLLLVGREAAELIASGGQTFAVTGDVLVSSEDYGLVSGDLSDPADANGVAGAALIEASQGGTLNIGGNVRVSADAFAGLDLQASQAGTAQGGTARFGANGGNISVTGSTIVSSRAFGTDFSGATTDGEVRAGTAELFVAGQGDVNLTGELLVTAEAFGRSLGVSVAAGSFGGVARVSNTGGVLTLNSDAFIDASANGADVFSTGNGALADAGEALLEVDQGGQTTIAGILSLSANAIGGINSAGRGGNALGGVALASTRGGGSLLVESDFFANAEAVGGNGTSGGDASGGIAGATAVTGSIGIGNLAVADSSGFGGSAAFGFGGDGGIGRGGNSSFQATGTLTETASLSIGFDASLNSSGFGGQGGDGDGQAIAPGRGGDGFGGEPTTPNQADPDFNSGAILLAGGDIGTLSVGGLAFVTSSGFGGGGGFSGGQQPGGQGGNGFGGLAQTGLALLGLDGSLGLGSATFASLLVEAVGVGGTGGFSINDFPTGNGGNGTGGRALLGAAAGDVVADTVTLIASGFGGDGARGGDGTGGERSGASTNSGGTLTLGNFAAYAHGAGGAGFGLGGGNGQGGQAFMGFQDGTTVVNGGVIVDATGFGGTAFDGGTGGTGTGGIADLAVFVPVTGSGTITGNAAVVANGIGGAAGTDGLTGGNGFGGRAFIQSQAGGTIRIGSAQVTASGLGGGQNDGVGIVTGGNGTGGSAELLSSDSGSQLIIERNFASDFSDQLNGGGIVSAIGIGADTNGGTGIGGTGNGGAVLLSATLGGSITLPQDPFSDPNSVGSNRLLAYGIGGGSEVEGGSGGSGGSGSGTIEADGGTIIMGRTEFSVFGEGGSSLDTTRNIAGGGAFGGSRVIRVLNGGTLTAEIAEGLSGGFGGNGSGDGNGGFAVTGRSRIEVINGTLNIVGNLSWVETSTGGNGNIGGDVFGGEGVQSAFDATDATIDFTPNIEGESSLILGADLRGGDGAIEGGDVNGGIIRLDLSNSVLNGGNLLVEAIATGGDVIGQTGRGGNAQAVRVSASFSNSDVALRGLNIISSEAFGGASAAGSGIAGGEAGNGGGLVELQIADSDVTILPGANSPGALIVSARASGGAGDQIGNATSMRSVLELDRSSLTLDDLLVESLSFANAITTGQQGGAAQSGSAVITVDGDQFGSFPPFSSLTAGTITLAADALTSGGGTATAGEARFTIVADRDAVITADDMILTADADGADPGTADNIAGRFEVSIGGGDLNTTNLSASARGDALASESQPSQLIADGGNINVSGNLDAQARGDIEVRTGQGGIIGSPANATTTTAIALRSQGSIDVFGDNGAVIGLGGDEIALTAREIDIADGARIGARSVEFYSLERDHTAIIGGNNEEIGFTLTAAEIARISADEFTFVGSSVITSDPDQPDVLIRDFTISGSLDDGFSRFRIFPVEEGPGIVRIEGTVSYVDAASGDEFRISAGGRIEVVTPGGIRIAGSGSLPGGILTLDADNIWVADADTIAQLQSDIAFSGRDELLAVAAQGSADPLGYLRAGGVSIIVGQSLLVRNTGGATGQGGILVGGGGLSIAASSSQGEPLDVFAYGRRQRDDGTFVVGEEFFSEVNFNRTGQSPAAYLELSALNDCIINTGECPQAPPPPPPPSNPDLPPLNNPTIILDPVTFGDPTGESVAEQDDKFGMDFPERPEAPLISEEPLLDDPVTSGSDASLYSLPRVAPGEEK